MSPRSVALVVLWLAVCSPAAAQMPNDPRISEQWAVAPRSVFNLQGAWNVTRGAGVTVAVIDTGARIEHPDLAPNVWVNFGEVPRNRADDDGNGYVDDVHGVDLTSTAKRQDLTDGYGHGTHVAGTIAAAANGRGVAGVAPRARLMIVKVIPTKGAGRTSAVAEGIRYAVANGAQVINMSLGGTTRDNRVRDAILAAADANVVVICSAATTASTSTASPRTRSLRRAEPDRRGGDAAGHGQGARRLLQLRAADGGRGRARRGCALDDQRRRLRADERDLDGRAARRGRGRADALGRTAALGGGDPGRAAPERGAIVASDRLGLRRRARRRARGGQGHGDHARPAAAAPGRAGAERGPRPPGDDRHPVRRVGRDRRGTPLPGAARSPPGGGAGARADRVSARVRRGGKRATVQALGDGGR